MRSFHGWADAATRLFPVTFLSDEAARLRTLGRAKKGVGLVTSFVREIEGFAVVEENEG